VKTTLFWAVAVSFAACSFDRSPLLRQQGAQRPAVSLTDPGPGTGFSDAQIDLASSGRSAADSGISLNTSVQGDGSAGPDATLPGAAAGSTALTPPGDPQLPASIGGLVCAGTPCPFAPSPATQCCTTPTDVTRFGARAADRCGLDLSALGSPAYGDGCWQRDQLGIVDDRCPGVVTEPGSSPEPGCCADDGQCGTVNASQKLGCRHAPGAELHTCQEPASNTSCDPTGTFGVRFNVDAAWGGRSGGLWALTDDGRGKIQVYISVTVRHVDASSHELIASGRVCGVTLPPFYSTTLCEAYLPQFPDSVWESKALAGLELSGRYECSGAGCVISLNPLTYLLGFELANPEAPWPSSSQTATLQCPSGQKAQCFPDHDGDGKPGVQLLLATSGTAPNRSAVCLAGYGYRGTPVSGSVAAIFNGVRRADRLLLGARMKVGASFRLGDDCATAHGSAVAEYVNSRAYGCMIQPGTADAPFGMRAGANEACATSEAEFIDANLPVYELLTAGSQPIRTLNLSDRSSSRGPEVSVVRLDAAAAAGGCNAVRSAKY
jgi:hypothetical protein